MEFGLTSVSQSYGSKVALARATFELEPGITALLGPNGAGKTTLMRTFVTELRPKTGHVVLNAKAIVSRRDRREARSSLGYLPQNFGYDSRFTVREHVEYLAWLRGIPSTVRRSAAIEAIAQVGLEQQANTKLGALSGGSRQRAGISGAIVGSPDVLVLDEPTVGLDPSQRALFREILTTLPAERVLLSTHLTDDVESVCNHIVLLEAGRVIAETSVENFIQKHGSVERGYLETVGNAHSLDGSS